MDAENFDPALFRRLELPDEALGGADARAQFEARFTDALQRLERRRGPPTSGEAESLLSALGAAQVQEWEIGRAHV